MYRDEAAEKREECERRRRGIQEMDPWYGHQATDVTHALHNPVPKHSSHPRLLNAPVPCHNRSATDVTSLFHSRPNSPSTAENYYGRTDTDVTAHLQVPVPKFTDPYGHCGNQMSQPFGGRYGGDCCYTPEEAHSRKQRAFDYMHPLGTHRPFPLSNLYYHCGSRPTTPSGSRSPSPYRRRKQGSRSRSRTPSPGSCPCPPGRSGQCPKPRSPSRSPRRSPRHSPRGSPRPSSGGSPRGNSCTQALPVCLPQPGFRRRSRSPSRSPRRSPRRGSPGGNRYTQALPVCLPQIAVRRGSRSPSGSPRSSPRRSPRGSPRSRSRSVSPGHYAHLPQNHHIPSRYLECRKRCQLSPPCPQCAVYLEQDMRKRVQFADQRRPCAFHGLNPCPRLIGLPCYGMRPWSPPRL